MLNKTSSNLSHHSQNAALILLSLLFLPISTFILFASYLIQRILPSHPLARRLRILNSPSFTPKTILVTGVGMSKGLVLARLFHSAGHTVIGADFEPSNALVCGRVSRSLTRFYRLSPPNPTDSTPYTQSLVNIIKHEKVDLWVSCSGVASAVSDGEAQEAISRRCPTCKSIQFDVATTQKLHEKHSFIEYTKEMGLLVPETHTVTSAAEVTAIVDNAKGKTFIMKSINLDDSSRGDLTTFPRPSAQETQHLLSKMRISQHNPWILQQYIRGPEYCTHSLIINGKVKAFVACPSSELLMHYQALSPDSPLSQAMLEFTQKFVEEGGHGFTGHLSFDFLLRDGAESEKSAKDVVLYPIECNPRAHTAVVLFNDTLGLVDAYLSVFDAPASTAAQSRVEPIVRPRHNDKYYWIGHDLVALLLLPVFSFIFNSGTFAQARSGAGDFLEHVLTWKDGTYEIWDPLPWWWLYHVYWPMRFLHAMVSGQKWSRVNVSTTKMFGC